MPTPICLWCCASGRFAAKKVIELGLDKKDPRVQFAQLKGMSDSLSLALARGGFNVSKYLPFGPVAHVIPYLLRRAEENRGLLGNTKADRRRVRYAGECLLPARVRKNMSSSFLLTGHFLILKALNYAKQRQRSKE